MVSSSPEGSTFFSLEDRIKLFPDANNHNCEVSLGGGEPTLHPDFDQIVDVLQSKGYDIILHTNELGDITRKNILKFNDDKFITITCSYNSETKRQIQDWGKKITDFNSWLHNEGPAGSEFIINVFTYDDHNELIDLGLNVGQISKYNKLPYGRCKSGKAISFPKNTNSTFIYTSDGEIWSLHEYGESCEYQSKLP
jgi:hypothetical protein